MKRRCCCCPKIPRPPDCSQFELESVLIAENDDMNVTGNLALFTKWNQYLSDILSVTKKPVQPPIVNNPFSPTAVAATGTWNVNLTNGNVTYTPADGEIPAPGGDPVLYCCCFAVLQESCPCADDVWMCATVQPEADPCAGLTTGPVVLTGTCPSTVTLTDLLVQLTGWTTAAIITSVNSGGNTTGITIAQDQKSFTYQPQAGQNGTNVSFSVALSEGGCAKTIELTLQLDDFCLVFDLEDVAIANPTAVIG